LISTQQLDRLAETLKTLSPSTQLAVPFALKQQREVSRV